MEVICIRYLEKYKEILNSHQHHAPISELIGMKLITVEEGKTTFELEVKKEFFNSIGVVQGGLISIIADAAMGVACGTLLDEEYRFYTIEFKINFFKPVKEGKLIAYGKVVNKGKTVVYTEAEVYNSKSQLIAKAVGSCLVFKKNS